MNKNFAGQTFNNQSFRGQDLTGADFSHCVLNSCDFQGADLTDVRFCAAQMGVSLRWKMAKELLSVLYGVVAGWLNFMLAVLLVGYIVGTLIIAVAGVGVRALAGVVGWLGLAGVVAGALALAIALAVAVGVAVGGAGALVLAGTVAGAVIASCFCCWAFICIAAPSEMKIPYLQHCAVMHCAGVVGRALNLPAQY